MAKTALTKRGTVAEIKREFEIYNKLNTRVKNQATHISISFAAGERVEAAKKIEFAEKLLEKLNFKNVSFLVVEHHDKEYEHFHIIAGRIRDDGTTVKEWKIAERAIEVTPQQAQDEVLEIVEKIEERYQTENKKEHPLTKIAKMPRDFGITDFAEKHDFYANGKLED